MKRSRIESPGDHLDLQDAILAEIEIDEPTNGKNVILGDWNPGFKGR